MSNPNVLVTMSKLVRDKEFEDLEHFKLLFSVGGGSNSTKPGALFTVLKVSLNRSHKKNFFNFSEVIGRTVNNQFFRN